MSDTNTSSSAPVKKNITRRDVLAMAGCGVAGLVVGGVLASWGVTQDSIASGRIELRTTPTKMIVTDRARCSGCQRCEMMCTLQNDGASQPAAARIHVHDGFNFGSDWESFDGIYYSCEWQIRACHMCTTALCQTSCPHGAIITMENGTRTVDPDKCGLRYLRRRLPVAHARGEHRDPQVHQVHRLRPLRRPVPQRRSRAHQVGEREPLLRSHPFRDQVALRQRGPGLRRRRQDRPVKEKRNG